MNNPHALDEISKNARLIFLVSFGILLISLLPVSYGVGYSNGLTGAAGMSNTPTETPPEIAQGLTMSSIVSATAGVVSSISLAVSAIASAQKMRIEKAIEEMRLKAAQLEFQAREKDQKMQLKEIERLQLELELEKREKRRKKI